ncbi:MAG: hypothetical protein HY737_00325 [Candidatus Omnitrophica bacterium]|nr:hypothetical protein [Candidatus Omnitrophota bacterium]
MRARTVAGTMLLSAICYLLSAGLVGCESLQKKLTRKSKRAPASPTPIINFLDYSRAMTPLDRYRKHALMFDYWNDQVLQALASPPINPKRYKHASAEALNELNTMQTLVAEDVAARLAPMIEERTAMNHELQHYVGEMNSAQASAIHRRIDAQTRQIQRSFSWRDVQDQLKP